METLDYINNEASSNLVERKINEERKKTLEDALSFRILIPLEKYGLNLSARLPFHKAFTLYVLNWIIVTIITDLYLCKVINQEILYVTLPFYISLLILTFNFLYQSYKKWYKN